MQTLVIVVAAAAMTALPAWYSMLRWRYIDTDPQIQKWVERLHSFPEQFGEWSKIADYKLDQVSADMLTPLVSITRNYSNGNRVANIFVLLGPTGPTAVHTPDICFDSQEFKSISKRQSVELGGRSRDSMHTAWQIDFVHRGLDARTLRTWYAWSDGGNWHASERPRFEFAHGPVLFKFQVAIAYPDEASMKADGEGLVFVNQLIQAIEQHVFR